MKNIYLQIPLDAPEIHGLVLATVTGMKDRHLKKPEFPPFLIRPGFFPVQWAAEYWKAKYRRSA